MTGDRLLLWNFAIGSAEVRSEHLHAIRQFFHDRTGYWISTGPSIHILGRASSSGSEGGNQQLRGGRAAAVHAAISAMPSEDQPPGSIIDEVGLGVLNPIATESTPEGMALNRSVEIVIDRNLPGGIVEQDRVWTRAREMLESSFGTLVGGSADVLWTPTQYAIACMLPRFPLFEDSSVPPWYGTAVPTEPLSSARPASQHMPPPRHASVQILADMLRAQQQGRSSALSDAEIRLVVDTMRTECASSQQFQAQRIHSIMTRLSADIGVEGLGTLIRDDLRRYVRMEREYLLGDPTCLWRYVMPA